MRLVRVGVVLVMAVVPARYCHAQESPDRITDGEEVCRERLAIELGKFAGRQVSCLGACIARRRTDPNADCGLFDGDWALNYMQEQNPRVRFLDAPAATREGTTAKTPSGKNQPPRRQESQEEVKREEESLAVGD